MRAPERMRSRARNMRVLRARAPTPRRPRFARSALRGNTLRLLSACQGPDRGRAKKWAIVLNCAKMSGRFIAQSG